MKKLITLFVFCGLSTAHAAEGILVLQLKGDSGSSIATLNKKLKMAGVRDRLPESIELSSKMSSDEIHNLADKLNGIVDKASKNEMILTSAYGEKINEKTTCFKGNNEEISGIYDNMVDTFVSDQFGILAVSTKDKNRVGIKYDETDSGSDGSWINIRRCE